MNDEGIKAKICYVEDRKYGAWEQALFCDEQTDIGTIYTCPSEPSNFDTADCLIYDTLAFSFGHRQDYIVSVSNVTTGELIGKFCKRDRAWEEPMNGLPLQELYVEDGDLKADMI